MAQAQRPSMNTLLPVRRLPSCRPHARGGRADEDIQQHRRVRDTDHHFQAQIQDPHRLSGFDPARLGGIVVYLNLIYTPLFEARSLVLVKSGWENRSPSFPSSPGGPCRREHELVSSEGAFCKPRFEGTGGEHGEG